jgi:hypothetical protein
MKRFIIVTTVIALVAVAVFGSQALADKPGTLPTNPAMSDLLQSVNQTVTDTQIKVTDIDDEVGDISAELANPAYGLEEIKAEVANIEGKVGDIEANVASINGTVTAIQAELGNVAQTEFYHDWVGVGPSTSPQNIWSSLQDTAMPWFTQKHFHLTIYLTYVDPGEGITVSLGLNKEDYTGGIAAYEELTADGLYTFEFEGSGCAISTLSISDEFSVAYSVMATYVP